MVRSTTTVSSEAGEEALASNRKAATRSRSMEQEPMVCRSSTNGEQPDLSFTIVWSPLPMITWFLPFVGHTGIADSNGVASDFQGPYFVGDDGRMAFGAPTRFLKLDITDSQKYDQSIVLANEEYRTRMHNICCDNCHSHVSYALNHYYDENRYGMVKIATLMFFRGRFLSWTGVVRQFLPFTIMMLVVCLIKR